MIKKELIVPKEQLNVSLKMVTREPFASVMLTVYDRSISYGDDMDVQTAAILGQLTRDQRDGKVSLSIQVDQADLEAGKESMPCTFVIKGLIVFLSAMHTKCYFRCAHSKIHEPRRILQKTLNSLRHNKFKLPLFSH